MSIHSKIKDIRNESASVFDKYSWSVHVCLQRPEVHFFIFCKKCDFYANWPR